MDAPLTTLSARDGSAPAPVAPPPARRGSRVLLAAVRSHDLPTARHCRDVLRLAARVARELELTEPEVAEVEQVALLHDVGKLAVPQKLLRKAGPLDEDEWAIVHEHPAAGAEAVAQVPELAHLAPAVRASHERWDGTGYPDGLAGEEIPIASRITFACDAYDAMRSDRPYRAALSEAHAVREVTAGSGTQFCPRAADGLRAVLHAA